MACSGRSTKAGVCFGTPEHYHAPPGPSLAVDHASMTPDAPKEPSPPRDSTSVERRDRTVGWHSKDIARATGLVIGMYLLLQMLWFAHHLVLVAFLGILFGLA